MKPVQSAVLEQRAVITRRAMRDSKEIRVCIV
jgi:hypothetical protein